MQTPIDRVMQAYGMMVNLTPEQERAARERLESHLAEIGADDNGGHRGSEVPSRLRSPGPTKVLDRIALTCSMIFTILAGETRATREDGDATSRGASPSPAAVMALLWFS
jgi:hypothetical protein